jgi:hypothetical protein
MHLLLQHKFPFSFASGISAIAEIHNNRWLNVFNSAFHARIRIGD